MTNSIHTEIKEMLLMENNMNGHKRELIQNYTHQDAALYHKEKGLVTII